MKKVILSAFALSMIVMFSCEKEKVVTSEKNRMAMNSTEKEVFKYSSPEEYDLSFAFKTHNQIMDNLLNDEYNDLSQAGYVNSVIETIELKSNSVFSNDEKEFIHMMNENFIDASVPNMVKLSIEKGYMTDEASKVMLEIDNHMQTVSYNNYDDAKRDLDYLQTEFVDKNITLSNSDKNQLTVLIKTMDNSAYHYKDFYTLDTRGKGKCGKCIRNHIGGILLADGVGALGGLVSCLIFPASCVALIPALMAVGSGGAMISVCHKECF